MFLVVYGLLLEWADRKIVARLQNRVGPPWFQPFADFIKLFVKEDISTEKSDKFMFAAAPILALASVLTSVIFLPLIVPALYSFQGDVVVLAYLLTVPTFAIFLGGWYSVNYFASVGAMRATLLLFSYEVPLLMSLLGPAVLVGTWNISAIALFQTNHLWIAFYQPIGFLVALVALVGKLERIPFDIPEAETEIVEGPFCEYTGRKLAIFRLMFDIELVIVASLISIFYLGGFGSPNIFLSALLFFAKTFAVICLVSLVKAVFGRIRIDQMVEFCWKFLVPAAILQYILVAAAKIWL